MTRVSSLSACSASNSPTRAHSHVVRDVYIERKAEANYTENILSGWIKTGGYNMQISTQHNIQMCLEWETASKFKYTEHRFQQV